MGRFLIIGNLAETSSYIKEFTHAIQKLHPSLQIELVDPSELKRYRYENNEFIHDPIGFGQSFFSWLHSLRGIRTLLPFIFGFFYFLFKSGRYHSVCFHYTNPFYALWVNILRLKSDALCSVIWGSDLYRTEGKFSFLYNHFYNKIDQAIIGTKDSMHNAIEKYPTLEGKINYVNFGNEKLFDYLQKQKIIDTSSLLKKWIAPFNESKQIITIGYNNKQEQQHLSVIEQISRLDDRIKSKIIILLPLTYPKNNKYKAQLINTLKNNNLDYKIIDKFCSSEEIMELRSISNIFVNMQTTDMFSASVLEYLSTGNIVLNGDWLPYSYIDENEIFAIITPIEKIQNELNAVLQNMNEYEIQAEKNSIKIKTMISWDALIPKWSQLLKL